MAQASEDGVGPARLSLATLSHVRAGSRPAIDPRELPVRVVHLGIGAFHRAHQAAFTEDANAAGNDLWGICGATQRSPAVIDQLVPQDCLYSLTERDGTGQATRVIGAVREVLWAKAQVDLLLDRIGAATTAIVTLTVTEKGYRTGQGRRLATDDEEVAADLSGRPPGTVVGQLVEGLARRAQAGAGPITVLCCDNIPDNGLVLRGLVEDYCGRRSGGGKLWRWVESHVTFPSCLVDRIVPATTGEDLAFAQAQLGLRDLGAVVAEPFRQWVIEDNFAAARPAWDLAGATFTSKVAPYERAKLRLLNGAHSTVAYLGALAGYELISEAVAEDSSIGQVAVQLMADDVAPTLEVPIGFDIDRYQSDIIRRFRNPALRHRTLQVAMDGTQKLPQRLVRTIAERRAQGATPLWAALGVAAWARFVTARTSDHGEPLTVDDPLEAQLRLAVSGAGGTAAIVDGLLGVAEVFEPVVRQDRGMRDLLVELLDRLARDGAERTAAKLLAERG